MTIPILSGQNPQALMQAAQALRQGQLVVIPTETVYGLGADADQDNACKTIYTTKGRPEGHPLIVHISSAAVAQHYALTIPDCAQKLIDTFWPGPLTIIVKRAPGVAQTAAGGHDTIGLRCPAHPVAQSLLHTFESLGGHGIAAPSANLFGRISPTTATHVAQTFSTFVQHPIALILDGGACEVGIESTIIDCSRDYPVLLRPGVLTQAQIEKAAGMPLLIRPSDSPGTPKAPGTLTAHYAPKAKVRLMDAPSLKIAVGMLSSVNTSNGTRIGVYAHDLPKTKTDHLVLRKMPAKAKTVAHELFAVLHDFDAQGVSLLWIEMPPEEPEWLGVRDRLERAAASG